MTEQDVQRRNDQRDAAMAAHLRQQFNALPTDARMLVLAGNVHAMRARPADAPPEMQQKTMAAYLLDLPLYSVRLEALRGHFWACFQPCRAVPLIERPPHPAKEDPDADRQHDLWIWMPALSVATLTDP